MAATPGTKPSPNLQLWRVESGQMEQEFLQKKQQDWCPQWTCDEAICSLNVNNEILFFENNKFDTSATKLHLQKLVNYALAVKRTAQPHYVAVHIPGTKGQPSSVRIFKYGQFSDATSAVANKSFYKAEKADLTWNNKGSAVLIQTSTESSAASYYGEQGLHYVDINGQSCLVPRAKDGPVYDTAWSPNSESFCVVYGTMPAKATLYNVKCEVIFDFGTGPRNCLYFNPHGNLLCLAGFGNLRGNVEIWDLKAKKLLTNPQAPDTTHLAWGPDGQHFATATTTPRLRVSNGYRLWHYSGLELSKWACGEGEELYELLWKPAADGLYPCPSVNITSDQRSAAAKQQEKPAAYVPPALRNKQPQQQQPQQLVQKPRYREEYEPPSNMKPSTAQGGQQPPMSKAALKNKKKRESKARKKEQGEGGEEDKDEDVADGVAQMKV